MRPVSFTIFCQLTLLATAFVSPHGSAWASRRTEDSSAPSRRSTPPPTGSRPTGQSSSPVSLAASPDMGGLMTSLTENLDKWIVTGSHATRHRAYTTLKAIETQASDPEDYRKAVRMARRAGLPAEAIETEAELGKNDEAERKSEAEARRQWEASRSSTTSKKEEGGRSALSRRAANNGKPDVFMGEVIETGSLKPKQLADDKLEFQKQLRQDTSSSSAPEATRETWQSKDATAKVADLVARAGALSSFEGEKLGIGGLDNVLSEVKRRIWTPLAAPPRLLQELGIHPVRGLLLYGRPGCGKTLLARKLGQMLSPLRPVTVVSGPEVLDKFVGSSEKNLRAVFDSPPDIYDFFRIGEPDGGNELAAAALHVVVMDEFDAIARTRGGSGGKGDQGDAGVARDSVVNQLLAKMDGVEPLAVPTLVIGLTNKRSLIDAALLRPGRFEVQIEVPPPRTAEQRASILKVHTESMYEAGRLMVRDAPPGSPAALGCQKNGGDKVPNFKELLDQLANDTDGFSGASLAGVARAAASHALERAVEDFTAQVTNDDDGLASASLLRDCLVTYDDLLSAVDDVRNSQGRSDWEEEEVAPTTSIESVESSS